MLFSPQNRLVSWVQFLFLVDENNEAQRNKGTYEKSHRSVVRTGVEIPNASICLTLGAGAFDLEPPFGF